MEKSNKEQIEITVASDDMNKVETLLEPNNNKQMETMMIALEDDEKDGVEASIRNELSFLHTSNKNTSIYKVPEFIRKQKERCYRPSVISIGPMFFKDPELKAMEELKLIFLESFLQHPKNACPNLDRYINLVREMKDDIIGCYQEQVVELSSDDEFIKMIVLDAVFLLFYFIKAEEESSRYYHPKYPPIPNKLKVLMVYMDIDILILENQLPFFVHKGMFDLAFPGELDFLINYIRFFIGHCNIPGAEHVAVAEISDDDASNIAHLLDLYRKCVCLSCSAPQQTGKPAEFPATAKQLVAAGVKIRKSESLNPLDITFDSKHGVLHIPFFTLDENSEIFLRNISHFEQCHYYCDDHGYFIDLLFFLDSLIESAEDVKILIKKEVLENVLGSHQKAADLFNNMTTDVYTRTFLNHYGEVSEQLNAYANKSCNKWMAILRRDYFKHPWAILSFIFAIIIFILTVLQTVTGFVKN